MTSQTNTMQIIKSFWGIRYQVRDVQRAIEFYTKFLGFKVTHESLPDFASVALDDVTLLLSGPHASGSRPLPDGSTQESGGSNRIVLEVVDLQRCVDALKRANQTFRNSIESGPGGSQIQVLDPDGNPVELFEPARRSR